MWGLFTFGLGTMSAVRMRFEHQIDRVNKGLLKVNEESRSKIDPGC